MIQYKMEPHKGQLNFSLMPWFNLFCIILSIIFILWINYTVAKISGFSPLKAILGGLVSFTVGILIGIMGGKWHVKAIEEKWREITGWKIFFSNYILRKTTFGKKVFNHAMLMILIPSIVIFPIAFIGFSKYRVILANCYFSYVLGGMSGLYVLPVYLWSRKLPD